MREIKARRIKNSFNPHAKVPRHGTKENRDLWGGQWPSAAAAANRTSGRAMLAPTFFPFGSASQVCISIAYFLENVIIKKLQIK